MEAEIARSFQERFYFLMEKKLFFLNLYAYVLFFKFLKLIFNTSFKGYFPLTAITEYWLYSPCSTVHPRNLPHAQQFGPPTPPLSSPPPSPLPTANH